MKIYLLEFDIDADGFKLINNINDAMIRWGSFEKRAELVRRTAHYVNEMNKLNSTCSKQDARKLKRRQIDSAFMTMADFGLKQIRKNILNKKLDELINLTTENPNSKSNSKY